MFMGYVQNNAAYRFVLLKDSFINESRDAKIFEHVFPLKWNVFSTMHEPVLTHDNICLCQF